MKPHAPSKPDPVFDVTKMSAQEIGAELARLTSTFGETRRQPETGPAVQAFAPSPAMLEARAAFLPPAAGKPLAPVHPAAEPAGIARAGGAPNHFDGDSSAHGQAGASRPDLVGPEEIDLADIDLEALGFMAYAVPREQTARRARASHAQARHVISAAGSRIRNLAQLPPRPHLHRAAILGSAALALVMTAGSWSAFRQFHDTGAPDQRTVTIAANYTPQPSGAAVLPAAPTRRPNAEASMPALEETGALAPLAVVPIMPVPVNGVAEDISQEEASVEEIAPLEPPSLETAPRENAPVETASTGMSVAEISPTSQQLAALAADPADSASAAPAPLSIAAPQPQSTVPQFKPAAAKPVAAPVRPSTRPEQANGGPFAALLRFIASAGDTVTVAEPAVLLLADAAEPATQNQSAAGETRIMGDGDHQEARPLQIAATRPSSAAPTTEGGTSTKAVSGASAKASSAASADSAGGGSGSGSNADNSASGADAGKAAGPSKNSGGASKGGVSKSSPSSTAAGSGSDGPADAKSKGGSKDKGSSGKDKGKGGGEAGGKGEGKGGSKGGGKGGN